MLYSTPRRRHFPPANPPCVAEVSSRLVRRRESHHSSSNNNNNKDWILLFVILPGPRNDVLSQEESSFQHFSLAFSPSCLVNYQGDRPSDIRHVMSSSSSSSPNRPTNPSAPLSGLFGDSRKFQYVLVTQQRALSSLLAPLSPLPYSNSKLTPSYYTGVIHLLITVFLCKSAAAFLFAFSSVNPGRRPSLFFSSFSLLFSSLL